MITLEMLDRSIFELLRKKVVLKGFLPDIVANPTSAQYKAAKDILRASTPLIDVCGVGYAEDRNEKSINKIVISRVSSDRGALGGWGLSYFEEYQNVQGDTRFKKYSLPDQQRSINYQIRIISTSARFDRIMDTIVTGTLGMNRQHKGVANDGSDTDKTFDMLFIGDADVSIPEVWERVYSYRVPDIFIGEEEDYLLNENIVPLQTVSFCISLVRNMADIDLSKGGCQGDENSSCITIGEPNCDNPYVEDNYWGDDYVGCEPCVLTYVEDGYWLDGYMACEVCIQDYVEENYFMSGYIDCEDCGTYFVCEYIENDYTV